MTCQQVAVVRAIFTKQPTWDMSVDGRNEEKNLKNRPIESCIKWKRRIKREKGGTFVGVYMFVCTIGTINEVDVGHKQSAMARSADCGVAKEIVVASDAKYNEIAYGSATKGLRNAKVTSGE